MNQIKVLSDNLINKIAAGEVLERPSSAVKELVENSIDASATKIKVNVRNGGKTEIRVSDNGHGLSKKDLELALKRHATSKLSIENFSNIKTLGFRGEALPSIASVSEMTIQSNDKYDQDGIMIEISSGNLKKIRPVNQSKGTQVSVKNLFFYTPARLKFLKSENYESLLIKRTIQKLALSYHRIEFSLLMNGKEIIKTNPIHKESYFQSLENRVSEVLGKEFVENTLKLDETVDNFRLRGLIGLPTFNHSNNNNQFVYVNGRVINDKSINVIFRLAYRDLISFDRYPQLILFIECPPSEVDINVHPAKSEVRFQSINHLRSLIIRTFNETFSKSGLRTNTLNTRKAVSKINSNFSYQKELTLKEKSYNQGYFQNPESKFFLKKSSEEDKIYPLGFARSQFHNTYVISETKTGIIIVDQHAAHERIVYEKLKKDYYNKDVKTQILLIPVIIDLEKIILDNLKGLYKISSRYGLEMDQFGNSSVIVREIPYILTDCDVKKLALDVIDELIENKNTKRIEKQIDSICSRMSCHGSIRAGRELQVDEMNDLLRKIEETPFSAQCNHGRPTYVELKLKDIEKLFGRK